MIPYGDFTFFLIALIALLPVIILGFLGKRSYIYNGVVTAFMIVLIFSSDKHNLFDQKYLSVQIEYASLVQFTEWMLELNKSGNKQQWLNQAPDRKSVE